MSATCDREHLPGEKVCAYCCPCDYCTVIREVEAQTFPVEDPPDRPDFEAWALEQDYRNSQAEDQVLREDKEHGA